MGTPCYSTRDPKRPRQNARALQEITLFSVSFINVHYPTVSDTRTDTMTDTIGDTDVTEDELYSKAIEIFGESAQIDKAVEEAAERIQSLMKWKGHGYQKRHLANIIEEFADDGIMRDQLAKIMQAHMDPGVDFLTLVEAVRDMKNERLYNNLAGRGIDFKKRAEPAIADISTH